jgi:glycosyltransferase involved in cell wall biosynthesis
MDESPIIFFTQLYYPDLSTTSVIMTDLAEDLASFGMDVTVICSQPIYSNKHICPKKETKGGVKIERIMSFTLNKDKNTGRIFNGLSYYISMLVKLLRLKRKVFIIFNTNPALAPFLGFVTKKLKDLHYLVLIHDLWPELPANIGIIKKNGILYRLLDSLNILAFKHADAIVVLSNAMKERICARLPDKRKLIYIIPNWADPKRIYPIPRARNRLIEELGVDGKKVVMYSGNLGRYQPLEVIIDAAYELKHRTDILFLVAGFGWKKAKLQSYAKFLNLKNIRFLPFQPLERLAESLSMADLSLIGFFPENEGVVMPSKLYSLMAIAKPIISISSQDSEVVEILKEAKAGIHSSVYDPKELAAKIESLLDDRRRITEMGSNARSYFLDNFQRSIITKKWQCLLEHLI